MNIEQERPQDASAIRALTQAAFEGVAYSQQTEARIVDALRAAGALTISLVARVEDRIVGHAAFSPVEINGVAGGWFGLGPVSVSPTLQGQGIGQALIGEGLRRLKALNAAGCVVLGHPGYYGRFGFVSDPELHYGQAPAHYFLRLVLDGDSPKGEVAYHPSFDVA